MCEPTQSNAKKVLDKLEKAHPDARIYLNFRSPIELLLATILSAQCTDEKVNQVMPKVWESFPTVSDIARADIAKLEQVVRPTGFFRQKARRLKEVSRAIVEDYGGNVPESLDELTRLPGIGRKTANVVLSNAFGQPGIAVDTHVERVSQRIGLAHSKEPDKIEKELCAIIPRERWTRATHLIGTHGRRICTARKPRCEECPVSTLCDYHAANAAKH
jgi:endonuclease-3